MLLVELNELDSHTGSVIGHSPWKTISQEMIQAFADATGDHQWIHVDVERATREAPWKSPVAHGFLTVSLIPQLNQEVISVQGTSASINYGMNKLRFRRGEIRSGNSQQDGAGGGGQAGRSAHAGHLPYHRGNPG